MSSFHGHATETLVTLNQYFHDLIFNNCQIRFMKKWELSLKTNKNLSVSIIDTFCDIFERKKNPSNYLIDLEAFANSFNKRVHYVNTQIWTMCQ